MKIFGSTALVTGANRGIGRALVDALIAQGTKKIYVCSRDNRIDGIEAQDAEIVHLKLDICDQYQIQKAAEKADDVDLLFNNAGVLDFGTLQEVSRQTIQRNLDTNLFGPLELSKAFIPIIEQKGGAIVNTLTLLSLVSMPGLAAYNISKAAAWSMCLSLRADVANRNIVVHNVFPGAVDTDMLKAVDMPKTTSIEVARAIVAGVEAGKEDIFPDPMSMEVYRNWRQDHKAVEKQFASL